MMSLVLALMLTSCVTQYANLRRFNLDRGNPTALVVIDERPSWSTLGYVDNQNQLHVIRAQLDALGELRNLYLSPDRTKVMVESYGEGHQFLSIFVIEDLIAEHRKATGFIHAYRTLDPYPYGFWDIAWVTDDCIRFSAHADMTDFDPETRRGKITLDDAVDKARAWTWHLERDEFEIEDSQQSDGEATSEPAPDGTASEASHP